MGALESPLIAPVSPSSHRAWRSPPAERARPTASDSLSSARQPGVAGMRDGAVIHTPLCELLGIEAPIMQAPIQGSPALTAAVAEAGAFGMLGVGWHTSDDIRRAVRQTRERTSASVWCEPCAVGAPARAAGRSARGAGATRLDLLGRCGTVHSGHPRGWGARRGHDRERRGGVSRGAGGCGSGGGSGLGGRRPRLGTRGDAPARPGGCRRGGAAAGGRRRRGWRRSWTRGRAGAWRRGHLDRFAIHRELRIRIPGAVQAADRRGGGDRAAARGYLRRRMEEGSAPSARQLDRPGLA